MHACAGVLWCGEERTQKHRNTVAPQQKETQCTNRTHNTEQRAQRRRYICAVCALRNAYSIHCNMHIVAECVHTLLYKQEQYNHKAWRSHKRYNNTAHTHTHNKPLESFFFDLFSPLWICTHTFLCVMYTIAYITQSHSFWFWSIILSSGPGWAGYATPSTQQRRKTKGNNAHRNENSHYCAPHTQRSHITTPPRHTHTHTQKQDEHRYTSLLCVLTVVSFGFVSEHYSIYKWSKGDCHDEKQKRAERSSFCTSTARNIISSPSSHRNMIHTTYPCIVVRSRSSRCCCVGPQKQQQTTRHTTAQKAHTPKKRAHNTTQH